MKSMIFDRPLFCDVRRRLLVFVIGAIFVAAGGLKIMAAAAFLDDVLQYRILSEKVAVYFAAGLPWLELLVGLCLFVKAWRVAASFIAFLLSLIFVSAVGLALLRGLDVSCGCFGKAFSEYAGSGFTLLLRDLLLLGMTASLYCSLSRLELDGRATTE